MRKSVPDPPPEPSTKGNPTDDPPRDRSALYRAIDFYLTGEQPSAPDELRFYNVSEDVSFEDAQLYLADLLRCASVTAYQCGDQLKGAERAMVFSVWHLLEIAKAMVDRSIDCLGMKQG
ncbi:DUF6124 family protein [Pseudomonas sp. 10S4]|uniref:DUF6124 family protein n=1 Tax=Pseudomonas sp. 10S4 TaxID=3048583 RepID=UPI002AC9139C|nr:MULTISPECIES: hypothetical protein [unclassified Pseudomonas]MEB0228088.1 hypothetical protein [Pseudomonas sp. 5S1]MEB0296676.1 hypothetical protein [Pseudomonas sp. 10S4]WPX20153.1 hypothetical protein RHM58_09555 [Pseudomonas sp. 10S4]